MKSVPSRCCLVEVDPGADSANNLVKLKTNAQSQWAGLLHVTF